MDQNQLLVEAKKELAKNCLTLKMLGIRLPFNNIERFFNSLDKENKRDKPNDTLNAFKL